MSGGIELQINGQTINIAPHADPIVAAGVQPPELPFLTGEENGAIFFNLEWQTRHAEDLRQNLFTFFQTPNEPPPENSTNAVWRDLIAAARDHTDFNEFRHQNENFWQQVRQFSESRNLRDANGNETRTISRFEELLATLKTKNISLRAFAENLPPREREVFKARLQLEKTFGTPIFNAGTPDNARQNYSREILPDVQNAALLKENAAVFQNPANAAGDLKFVVARENQAQTAAPNAKTDKFGNPILQTAKQTVPGNSTGAPVLSEDLAVRVLNKTVSENPANNNPAAPRSDAAIVGGALINGAFNAIENHQNLRDDRIGDARAGAFYFNENGESSAAGATGALFGAAVGTLAASAETAVGGVLGFVSSVVVGVEVDRGLRWLGAGGETFGAVGALPANDQKSLPTASAFAPSANFQLVAV